MVPSGPATASIRAAAVSRFRGTGADGGAEADGSAGRPQGRAQAGAVAGTVIAHPFR